MERKLIDMRQFDTEQKLVTAYNKLADEFCQAVSDEIDTINLRLSKQFPGWGWSVVDMSDTELQLMSLRKEKATGIGLFGPTILYTFEYKNTSSHKNFEMKSPQIDESVRKMNDSQSAMDEVCKDEDAALSVTNNIQFANYIEVEIMKFLERFSSMQDDLSQFRDEFARRGIDVPEHDF